MKDPKKYVRIVDGKIIAIRPSGSGKEMPCCFPHVLAIEAWIDTFKVEPLYGSYDDSRSSTYWDIGDEAMCEECGNWHTVGEVEFTNYLSEETIIWSQKLNNLCCENCTIKNIFKNSSVSESQVKQNPEYYTTLNK